MFQSPTPSPPFSRWTDFIVPGIAAAGVLLTAIALWLKRRDKQPRLRLDIHKAYVPSFEKGPAGGNIIHPVPGFTIYVYNRSDNDIKLHSTSFVDGKGKWFQVPSGWKTIKEVKARDDAKFDVSIIEFNKWASEVGIATPEKGRFVLTDVLRYEHKTWKLRDALSLTPIDRKDLP